MSDKKLLVKAVLFGTVCGLLCDIILMSVFSVILMTVGLLPTEVTNYIMIALTSVSTLFGGFVTSKITKSAGLIAGLITGFAMFTLITVLGLINSSEPFTALSLIKLLATTVSGALGGVLGLNKRERIHIK